MIGRVGVLPLVGAVIVLAAGCAQETPSGVSSGAPAAAPPSPSAPPARDVTNKDLCGLVPPEALTKVAFPVTAGRPLPGGAFRFCQFPASDHAGAPVPDSVMIGAFPSGIAGAGEPVTVKGTAGSQILTKTECTLLLDTKNGTLQIVVARAGKGPHQCAIAQNVAAVALERL